MPALASLLCGFIFGSGLVISRMVQTTKVLGFLDVFGIGYALIRPHTPVFAPKSLWPTATDIDRPLITGAALFGIGWGLVGLCPGPAIADLATLSPGVFVFVIAMAVGMAAHDLWQARGARPIEQKLATATDG